MNFPNGEALTAAKFRKNYLIDTVTVENNTVVLALRENEEVNAVNWIVKEAVSFF